MSIQILDLIVCTYTLSAVQWLVCMPMTVFRSVCFCPLSIFLVKKLGDCPRAKYVTDSMSTSVCWLKNSVMCIALIRRCFMQLFITHFFRALVAVDTDLSRVKRKKSNAEA